MAGDYRPKRSVLGNWIVKNRPKLQDYAQSSFNEKRKESEYMTPPIDYSDDDDDNYKRSGSSALITQKNGVSQVQRNHPSSARDRRASVSAYNRMCPPPNSNVYRSVSFHALNLNPPLYAPENGNVSSSETTRPSSPRIGKTASVSQYMGNRSSPPYVRQAPNISPYQVNRPSPPYHRKSLTVSAYEGNRSSPPNVRKAQSVSLYEVNRLTSPYTRKAQSMSSREENRTSSPHARTASSVSSYEVNRSSSPYARNVQSMSSHEENSTSSPHAPKASSVSSYEGNRPSPPYPRKPRSVTSYVRDVPLFEAPKISRISLREKDYPPPSLPSPPAPTDTRANELYWPERDRRSLPGEQRFSSISSSNSEHREEDEDSNEEYFTPPVDYSDSDSEDSTYNCHYTKSSMEEKVSQQHKVQLEVPFIASKELKSNFQNPEVGTGTSKPKKVTVHTARQMSGDKELNSRTERKPSSVVPAKKPSRVRFSDFGDLESSSDDSELIDSVYAEAMKNTLNLPLKEIDVTVERSDEDDSKMLIPVDYQSYPQIFTGLSKIALQPAPVVARVEDKSSVEDDDARTNATEPRLKSPLGSSNHDMLKWIAASVEKANTDKRKRMKENPPDIFERGVRLGGMDDGGSSLSSASYGSCSSSGAEEVVLRIHVPELSVERCLTFHSHDLVWTVKQAALTSLPKELRESFNYGLFCPPQNGKAGKFLDEERPLADYHADCAPLGYLELKYKRRVYKMLKLEEKTLRSLHSRTNLRRFLEWVKEGNVEKVTKMCSKGLDPNFHDQETGDTPLTIAARGNLKVRKGCTAMLVALVEGGALLDYRTREGLTAMHRAVQADNLQAVRKLLDLGASPNYRDHRGLTPLYYCVTCAKDPLVCEALLHDYAVIGVADHQGWQETHQACRNKLVQHLEHLLFYGADLNGRNASGNTPLHVCAVNNLEDCARVLLFRGCDKNALNYANQNPYQVAVISGNLELAEIINKHQPEDVVPFKSSPRYNPRRRVSGVPLSRATSDPRLENPCVHKPPSPAPSSRSIPPFSSASSLSEASTGSSSTTSNNSSSAHPSDADHDGHVGGYDGRALPSGGDVKGETGREALSDTSSGICSSYQSSGGDAPLVRPLVQHIHPYQSNNVHGNVAEEDEDGEGEGSESESSNSGTTSSSGGSGANSSITYDVGTLVVCVRPQVAVESSQLSLNPGDIVQVSGSTDDGLLEGTARGQTGTFPPSCVQPVRLRNPHSVRDSFTQQQLIRTKSQSGHSPDRSLPHPGGTHYGTAPRARKLPMPLSRTVVLHRGKKGFGFVLRGAKALSPLINGHGSKEVIALQYLDEVDPDGVADRAGLKKGDYLLEINGVDVSQASHEHVVALIRKSADLVEMTVVTASPGSVMEAPLASYNPQMPPYVSNTPTRGSQTLPRKLNSSRSLLQANTPPAPPPRDPSTSLSVGRARARSVVGSLQQHSADCSESLSPSCSSGLPKLASIKARPASALRMTASQVEEMISSQNSAGSLPPSPSNSSDARPPRVYASVAEMKKAKALRSRPPADSRLHKVFHSTPDLTPAPTSTAPSGLSSDLNLQSCPGHSMTLNHPNSRHSMAGPQPAGYSGSSPAVGFYPKRVSQYDSVMHGSLDHRRLKRSQSAINSSQLLRDDGSMSPNAGAGQLVKVDISHSNSEYASVAQSVTNPGDPESSPTSPGIKSSFRPSDSAKLYASPEEIKSVGYRNPQMLAQLNRMKNSNYATSAKSRSQSLPPTTSRPPVSRLLSDPYADPIDKAVSHNDSPIDDDDDDLPLPPPPPEAELITYAKPQNNKIVAEANVNLMSTSCIVNKSGPAYDQNKQMSASFTGPSSSQNIANSGYSSEEENTYNSQYGDELNSRTIKRKKHTVAFAPNLVKSEDEKVKSKEISHYAAPVTSTVATVSYTASSSLSPKPNSAEQAENFSDLIAKKAEERRARLENGGNSSVPGSTNSSPNRKTLPPKAAKGLSDAILESALFNKQKEKVSNGDDVVNSESGNKVGSVMSILQKINNSKSFPKDFTQEDGESSSSGVSSDQEVHQEGSFVTVINTESNSISEAKPKSAMPKSNSFEEFSVSSESSEDASDRTCILTNDKTYPNTSKESASVASSKNSVARALNSGFVSKLPVREHLIDTSAAVAEKTNGTNLKMKSDGASINRSSLNQSLPASHPLATSQPLPGHLQGAIHPSNTHVGQAKFSTLQRPQSNSKRFTKAGSDPPPGHNYGSSGTLIRSRSINREELNLGSGSATLDRNFYQANKGVNASVKPEYERSIDESLQLIRMHMNSLNEVNSLAGIKASHPLNANLRDTNTLSPNANKGSTGARVEDVLAPPPQFSDTSGGQFRGNVSDELSLGRSKPSLRESEDEPDMPIRVYKRSNRRVEEDFVAASDDGRSFRYKTLDEWSTKDTTDWLESLFMPEYKDSFETKQIDGAKLLKINNESLINLGVRRVGHRVNMQKSLKRYKPVERIDL